MKKRLFILVLALMLIYVVPVRAASTCDYETQVKLNTEAANVKSAYEVKEFKTGNQFEGDEGLEDETEPGVENNIYNLTNNIYVTVTNSLDKSMKTYYANDADDGTISWITYGYEQIIEYTVKVYSNHEQCRGELLRTFSFKTPKQNVLAFEPQCQTLTNKYYCQEFITEDVNMSYAEFVKQADKDLSIQKKEEKEKEEKNNFWKKYGLWIIIAAVAIAIGVGATVIVKKIKRSSVK